MSTTRRILVLLIAVAVAAVSLVGVAENTASAGGGASFTADNPPSAVPPASGGPISSLVLAEGAPGAVPQGTTVCIEIVTPSAGVGFSPLGSDATVLANGGGAQASPPTLVSPELLTFGVSVASAGSPASFTVTGLSVDTAADALGQVSVHVGKMTDSGCGTDYSGGTVITAVIAGTRLAADDRYGTAADIFDADFSCPTGPAATAPRAALLARGDTFPDALAGSYLAGALHTGILLTPPDSLAGEAVATLQRDGIGTVYLLGGSQAVTDAVASQLSGTQAWACDPATGLASPAVDILGQPVRMNVIRVAGIDRYATAAAITARSETQPGTISPAAAPGSTGLPTAVIVSGANFPDALAAGPMGYIGTADPATGNGRGFPILLTDPATLSPAAVGAIGRMGIRQAIVVGGPAAVSTQVEDQLHAMSIGTIRLGGVDRSDTAGVVEAYEGGRIPPLGAPGPMGLAWFQTRAVLARGDGFADALAGGPHAGAARSPILLATMPADLGVPTYNALRDAANTKGTAYLDVLGGNAAIAPSTEDAAANALTGAVIVVGPTGFDISWPQCGGAYPPTPPFGIVGVNDGTPYTQNACLSTEYAWAATAPTTPQFYLNLSNPSGGPHWNKGGPQPCSGGAADLGCAYDFGWQAAVFAVSYAQATTGTLARRYWLDIETGNTWSSNKSANTAVIRGALDSLSVMPGVASTGIYSTGYQWGVITGSPSGFAGYANWIPGAAGPWEAVTYCTASATGGPVAMAQFPWMGFDGDATCF